MTTSMTRRDFFRRSAPIVAAAAVAPSVLAGELYRPRPFWDIGASCHRRIQTLEWDGVVTKNCNGVFVCVGKNGQMRWSPDGISWRSGGPPGPGSERADSPGPSGPTGCTYPGRYGDTTGPPRSPEERAALDAFYKKERELRYRFNFNEDFEDFKVTGVSFVSNPPHGHRFHIVKKVG